MGIAGIVVYGFSLRIAPESAREAALNGTDPFAAQTSFWIILLLIFAASLLLGLVSLKRGSDRLISGIAIGFGCAAVLVVLAQYVSFGFFR